MTDRPVSRRSSIVLGWIVQLFGATCALIALAHVALGPRAIPGSVPVNATMDSEDRFYACLFLGFGIALTWAGRDLVGRRSIFRALMLTFFVGGLARVVSWLDVGPPGGLFIFLGALELLLPPVLLVWSGVARDRRGRGERP